MSALSLYLLALLTRSYSLLGLLAWGEILTAAQPPQLQLRPAHQTLLVIDPANGQKQIQASSAIIRSQVRICILAGLPEERGASLAGFYPAELEQIRQAMRDSRQADQAWLITGAWRWWLEKLSLRRLADQLPLEMQKEIAAQQLALHPRSGWQALDYQQGVWPQAFYDLTNQAGDSLGADFMSTCAFGLLPERTANHHLILARTLDFTEEAAFDQYQLVQIFRPPAGQEFMSISWPGFWGVIIGLNRAGLGLVALSAKTGRPDTRGTPVPVLGREVLSEARTLDQAIAILQKARSWSAQSFLLGSGRENKMVVVEKTPERTAVRKMQRGQLLAGNDFQCPLFTPTAADPQSRPGLARARMLRLEELLSRPSGPYGLGEIATILRDRRGLGEARLGLGHPASINTLHTTQAVILDLTDLKAWVSTYPQPIGKFVAVSLKAPLASHPREELEPDAQFTVQQYQQYLVYHQSLQKAEKLYQQGQLQNTLALLMEIQPLNPADYRVYLLMGKALLAMGQKDEARYNFLQAQRLWPAYPGERQEIEKYLKELSEP